MARAPRIATKGTSRHAQMLCKRLDSPITRNRLRRSAEQLPKHWWLDGRQSRAVERELRCQRARDAPENRRELIRRRSDENAGASASSSQDCSTPRRRGCAKEQDSDSGSCFGTLADQRRGRQAVAVLHRKDDHVWRVFSERFENPEAILDIPERDGTAYRLS